MKRKKRKKEFVDDGRTVAPMNVDGMPTGTGFSFGPSFREPGETGLPLSAEDKPEVDRPSLEGQPPLSRREQLGILLGAMGSALLIGGIFLVAGLLFVLFCLFVWLK